MDGATVREAARLLESENRRLFRENLKLKRLLSGDSEQLLLDVQELEQQLADARQKLFGPSSEKRNSHDDKPPPPPPRKKEKQTGHGPTEQSQLPIEEEVYDLDEPDKFCTSCNGVLEEWAGHEEVSEEVDVVERRFVVVKHVRKKYRCRCGACIETAIGPKRWHRGGRYSSAFAIAVAIGKYADHLPLERQVRMAKRDGLIVTSGTLWDQLNALAYLVKPAYDALKKHVLRQPVIGADETTWRMMKKNASKTWYVWATCSPDAVYYELAPTRSGDIAVDLLDGYTGVVIVDGYEGYGRKRDGPTKYVFAACWAHVRRKFVEAEPLHPKECRAVLERIGKMYHIERELKAERANDARVLARRQKETSAIMDDIAEWTQGVRCLPQSRLRKAVGYMQKQWKRLRVCLSNPRVSLDNNATERALRGIVVGRKNHYGSRSERGTQVAAIFYSLIESAKLAKVNPRAYLQALVDAAVNNDTLPLPHQFLEVYQ